MKYKYLLLLAVLFFVTSCSVTKRKYIPGYSVNWHHKALSSTVDRRQPLAANSFDFKRVNPLAFKIFSQSAFRADTDSLITHKKTQQYVRPQNENHYVAPGATGEAPVIRIIHSDGPTTETPKKYSGKDDSDKDIFALLGLVFAFLFFPLGIIFSIIGLKSEYKGLAIVGLVISLAWVIAILYIVTTFK